MPLVYNQKGTIADLKTSSVEQHSPKMLFSQMIAASSDDHADEILGEYQVLIGVAEKDGREKYAEALASLLLAWKPKVGTNSQAVNFVREKIMRMFRDHSSFIFSAYFSHGDLESINLKYMDFSGAIIRALSFGRSWLLMADFSDSEITGVSFRHDRLRGADFTGADPDGLDLDGSDWFNAFGLEEATSERD